MKKTKLGRPPKPDAEKIVATPVRAIGRISDEDWSVIRAAADASGKTLTEWATAALLSAAKRGR